MKSDLSIVVIGGLNTDIVALGANKILKMGEHTYAEKLYIGPGGKSRNIAQMIAALSNKKNVAMVGKTSKDPYGLWKLPIDSLKKVGVNTNFVKIESFEKSKQFPGIALIPVDKSGNNQIYVLPGITNNFLPNDIDNADKLFQEVSKNNGILVLTLELPLKTALHAIKKANKLGIKVMFDPGGIMEGQNYKSLLENIFFLIKPNEHEAKILTGVIVKDFNTAKKAAQKLLNQNVENVFITLGSKGGYFFNKEVEQYIPIPKVKVATTRDETGCGDQTMAAFVDAISESRDVIEAAKIAILAGTLQFYRPGITPIKKVDLNNQL